MEKIKMIALDMDGTVLNDAKEMTLHTKETLEKAMEMGVYVVACTGRPVTAIPKEFLSLKGMRYAISGNGSRIVDLKEEKSIFVKTIETKVVRSILEVAKRYDTYHEVFIDGQGYTLQKFLDEAPLYLEPEMVNYMRTTRLSVGSIDELVERAPQGCDKVLLLFKTVEEKERAFQDFDFLVGYEKHGGFVNNIEITQAGVNKGLGILELGKHLGVKREEIMAVGDAMNDYAMIQEAGFGVVMKNGSKELKEIADCITDFDNNNNGVAKAVEKYVLQRGE